jgi:hypothetical protein
MKKTLLLLSSLLIITACAKTNNNGLDMSGYIVPALEAIVLNESTIGDITNITTDGMINFSTVPEQISNIPTGSILVIDANKNLPDGGLKKVVDVNVTNGEMSLLTEDASVEETIEEGDIIAKKQISSSEIKSFKTEYKNSISINGIGSGNEWASEPIVVDVKDLVLFDYDLDNTTTNDQVTLNGSIEITPSFTFDLQVGVFRVKSLKFVNTTVEKANLEITTGDGVKEAFHFADSIDLAKLYFDPVSQEIDGFPTVLSPSLVVTLVMDAEAGARIETSMEQKLLLRSGVEYNGKNWEHINNSRFSYEINSIKFEEPATVNIQSGMEFKVVFLGSLAPRIGVEPYVAINAKDTLTGKMYFETYTDNFIFNVEKFEHEAIAGTEWNVISGFDFYYGILIKILNKEILKHEQSISKNQIVLTGSADQNLNEKPKKCHTECHDEKVGCNTERICKTICE